MSSSFGNAQGMQSAVVTLQQGCRPENWLRTIPEFDKSVNFAATSADPLACHWLTISCILPREAIRRPPAAVRQIIITNHGYVYLYTQYSDSVNFQGLTITQRDQH